MSNTPTAITIRPATPADAAALSDLGRRTFVDAFGTDNTPEDLAAFLDAAYSRQLQEAELRDAALSYLVAERPGELVAFALLRSGKSTPYVTDPTALEVQRFYVDRSCHGTGLAQTLMASCIEEAARRGARTLWLGVWERNPRAIRFYKAQGFVEIGTQIFVVGSDPQQDVVLSRPIADRSS